VTPGSSTPSSGSSTPGTCLCSSPSRGFLAASALSRSTAALQVRARFRRLGVPLVIGMLTVVPLANFFVIEAAALWPRKGALPAKRELDLANVFSFTPRHLWFISYLLIISLLAIGIWLAIQRAARWGASLNRGFGLMMRSWWAVPVLASISAAILVTKTGWVAGGSESNSLIPTPTLFAYFGLFFGFGWLLSGQSNLIEELKRGAWLRLGAGVLIAVPAFLLFYNNGDFTRQHRHPRRPGRYRNAAPLRAVRRRHRLLAHPVRHLGNAGAICSQGVAGAAIPGGRELLDLPRPHPVSSLPCKARSRPPKLADTHPLGTCRERNVRAALGSYALIRESRRQIRNARARHAAVRSTALLTVPEGDQAA